MTSSKSKLTYFPARSRAEVIRLVLMAAGEEFDDVIVPFVDWEKIKPSTPFGQLPTLEIDGEIFTQSVAIVVYLARKYDLYGSDNLERLRIDQILNLKEELLMEDASYFWAQDQNKKAEQKEKLLTEIYPRYFGYFEKMVSENRKLHTGSRHTVGNKLSLGDILIYDATRSVVQMMKRPDIVDKYPNILIVIDSVLANDGIKSFVDKGRPEY